MCIPEILQTHSSENILNESKYQRPPDWLAIHSSIFQKTLYSMIIKSVFSYENPCKLNRISPKGTYFDTVFRK